MTSSAAETFVALRRTVRISMHAETRTKGVEACLSVDCVLVGRMSSAVQLESGDGIVRKARNASPVTPEVNVDTHWSICLSCSNKARNLPDVFIQTSTSCSCQPDVYYHI